METINQDGELVEKTTALALIDAGTVSLLEKAQIDVQITTARAYPRSIKLAIDNILTLATLDEQTATECIYALPRGNKPIRGPSIRLAEIVAQCWGNNRVDSRVVQIDRVNKLIVAEGSYMDLETNTACRSSVQRRISNSKGHLFNDDMIAVTGNAACAIARRNAVLAGIPKGVWRKAQDEAERVIKGDVKTLVERRASAVSAFAHFGLKPEQVFQVISVQGLEDIGLDDLATLRVMFTSIKNGEQTVEDLLRINAPAKQRIGAATADLTAPKQFAAAGVPTADQTSTTEATNAAVEPAQAERAAATLGTAVETGEAGAAPGTQEPKPSEAQKDVARELIRAADTMPTEEPNDLDIVAGDIATHLRAVAGNNAAVDRVMSESRGDFESLDAPRQKKLEALADECRKPKARKVA